MSEQNQENQTVKRRKPAQERARHKVELILEAATRIIDQDGLDGLTTNRIAETAGISIGTLYQYFSDKQAIIDKLGQLELRSVTSKLLATLQEQSQHSTEDQARQMISTVFGAFGGRSRVYRLLLGNALANGNPKLLDDTANLVAGILTSRGVHGSSGVPRQLSKAEAFVLTWAFVGVTRASVEVDEATLPREQIEEALLRLIRSFI